MPGLKNGRLRNHGGRMNSCCRSLLICPVAVRKRIAAKQQAIGEAAQNMYAQLRDV